MCQKREQDERWGRGNFGHETWEKLDMSVPSLKMERQGQGHGQGKSRPL